jgi:phenylacetate-coenzyme A ligase PaaK-like adenylate-forming protein
MDEIKEDEYYEIVITTLKGGAFARYRIGDIFKCETLSRPEDGIMLPHFRYVDRVDPIIDLAGFTRITEATINEVLHLSHLHIDQWFARKSYDSEKRPYINLCVEINHPADDPGIDDAELIKEQLEIYFKYIDNDYKNLQRMLGIEPLKITILPGGSIQKYQRTIQHKINKVNPSHYDVMEILKIAFKGEGGDFS